MAAAVMVHQRTILVLWREIRRALTVALVCLSQQRTFVSTCTQQSVSADTSTDIRVIVSGFVEFVNCGLKSGLKSTEAIQSLAMAH